MSKKFYYLDEDKYLAIGHLFQKQSEEDFVLLNSFGDFSDIARWNSKYNTIVFVSVPTKSLYK